MAVNKGEIGIYGILRRDGGDNILAKTDLIQDSILNKTQQELNSEAIKLASIATSHISNTNNPHSVTKTQIGLSNVTNDSLVKRSEMGVANGVATLDNNGLVPSNQLPSYVDDVEEYETLTSFPIQGETGKIYVATDTNLTYRWSGSDYIEISKSLALGETSSTAYAGDKGKALADNLAAHTSNTNNPHKVTKALLGLENVDNTADAKKSVKNADTVDGYHASISNTPWGTIQAISSGNGVMEVGRSFEFHYDNTTGSDYSTTLYCTGNNGNLVALPSKSGTLALNTIATSSDNGLMSSSDKSKLDGLTEMSKNEVYNFLISV